MAVAELEAQAPANVTHGDRELVGAIAGFVRAHDPR